MVELGSISNWSLMWPMSSAKTKVDLMQKVPKPMRFPTLTRLARPMPPCEDLVSSEREGELRLCATY